MIDSPVSVFYNDETIIHYNCKEMLYLKKTILNIIFVIALICFCFSAYKLGTYWWHARQTVQMSNELAGLVNDTDNVVVDSPAASSDSGSDKQSRQDMRDAMMKKYGELYNRNSDFIGWLSIEGTDISYPVMQTPDEPEKYLEMNFDGDFDYHGTLFADARCRLDPENVSTDTIIYGHHMKDRTMFGSLPDFENADYCKEHNMIRFDTLYRPGTYRIFAVILDQAAEIGSDHVKDIYYNFIDAEDEASLREYLDHMYAAAVYYDPENEPKFGDEILTLSTCNYHVTDGRLALIAVRVD